MTEKTKKSRGPRALAPGQKIALTVRLPEGLKQESITALLANGVRTRNDLVSLFANRGARALNEILVAYQATAAEREREALAAEVEARRKALAEAEKKLAALEPAKPPEPDECTVESDADGRPT